MYRRMGPKELEAVIEEVKQLKSDAEDYANQFDEDHPIWKAIDTGGGQTCDVRGVFRQLYKAGYTIVRR